MASSFYSTLLLALVIMSICATTAFGLDAAATESAASTDNANLDSLSSSTVINQYLTAHNVARRAVGTPPLSWDTKLAFYAKEYAAQRRGDCQLVHSPGWAYGENIFWGKGRRWSVPDVMAAWVSEKQWYRYDTNSCAGQDCTHYTQIVWRTTQRVGCAKIVCNSGDTFAVCEYDPPGNYVGARPYL